MEILFVLLRAEPSSMEKTLIFLAPILSGLALTLSAAAFVFSVFFQLKERKRNIRQTLTTALSEIAKINLEIEKLDLEDETKSFQTSKMLDNYNAQRGTLVSDADFLINQNQKIVTDIDCKLMALTYNDLGNNNLSEKYWKKAISLSPTEAQKHSNISSYANYLFSNNEIEKATAQFERALKIKLSSTDNDHKQTVETYLAWAKMAKDFGDEKEFKRLLNEGMVYSKEIRNKEKLRQVEKLLNHFKK
jgi:tetratricopeptide (TPR) repeat protein